jgi:Alpha/beta-hydrolase family N-terminus
MSDAWIEGRAWFKEDVGSALAARTALMAAIGSTGATFGRSLMPRTLMGQALATGLTGSVNYGLLVTSQSVLWAGVSSVAARYLPSEMDAATLAADRTRVRVTAYGTFAAAAAAAGPLAGLISQKPGESLVRSATRSYLLRTRLVGRVGLAATALMDATLSLAQGRSWSPGRRRVVATGLTLAAGTALATLSVHRERQRQAAATDAPPPDLEARSVLAGAGTALGLTFLGQAEAATARGIAGLMPDPVPGAVSTAVGHSVCLGVLGVGAWQGLERLYGSLDQAGSSLEVIYERPPASTSVSGGPASALDWTIMSREGRRFASVPLSQSEIASVVPRTTRCGCSCRSRLPRPRRSGRPSRSTRCSP